MSAHDRLSGPHRNLAIAGDSLMAGTGGGGVSTPQVLGGLLGVSVYNPAVPGEASGDIRLRSGVPVPVRVPGGVIPEHNGFAVSLADLGQPGEPWGWRIRQTPSYGIGEFVGRLAGIPFRMLHDVRGDRVEFRRLVPGSELRLQPDGIASFVVDEGAAHRGDLWLICAGRNNMDRTQILRDVHAIVDWIGHEAYLILPPPPASSEPIGTPERATVDAIRDALAADFSGHFADDAAWMAHHAAAWLGLTLGAKDRADVASGVAPRSLRADEIHYNAAGYYARAHFIAERLAELGIG